MDPAGAWVVWPWQPPSRVGRWITALRRLLRLQAPHPRRWRELRERWGVLRLPQGLAKPQVCYETLPVVETFLRDRLPRLLPGCLLSPHSPSLTLYSLPWSLALTHFSLCPLLIRFPQLPPHCLPLTYSGAWGSLLDASWAPLTLARPHLSSYFSFWLFYALYPPHSPHSVPSTGLGWQTVMLNKCLMSSIHRQI